mmetsp:Transcript_48970/g.129449  ORF Transcript_48970/g.129449 Transcript_48970/m.129449 type:complete len:219 (+) Transcript_48970:505-1161(+)
MSSSWSLAVDASQTLATDLSLRALWPVVARSTARSPLRSRRPQFLPPDALSRWSTTRWTSCVAMLCLRARLRAKAKRRISGERPSEVCCGLLRLGTRTASAEPKGAASDGPRDSPDLELDRLDPLSGLDRSPPTVGRARFLMVWHFELLRLLTLLAGENSGEGTAVLRVVLLLDLSVAFFRLPVDADCALLLRAQAGVAEGRKPDLGRSALAETWWSF